MFGLIKLLTDCLPHPNTTNTSPPTSNLLATATTTTTNPIVFRESKDRLGLSGSSERTVNDLLHSIVKKEYKPSDKLLLQWDFESLIANGADVNATDKYNQTPLHLASEKGHLEIAQLLIENRAEVNATDFEGVTPLHRAVYSGHLEIAKLLIANGAKLNAKNKYGNTPLHRAADSGNLDAAKLLIEHGADLNATSKCVEIHLFIGLQ